jgi:hypothetical protein
MPSRARKDKRNLKNKANRWAKILFDALPELCDRLKEVKDYPVFRANMFIHKDWYHMNEHGDHFLPIKDDDIYCDPHRAVFEVLISFTNSYYSFWIPFESFDNIHLGHIPLHESYGFENKLSKKIYDPVICAWMEEVIYKQFAMRRMKAIKPDLIAAAWHPRRVERWLEQGVELENL